MSSNSQTPFPGPSKRDQSAWSKPFARILVVDDDAELRQLNANVLTKSGYEVGTAEDGVAALTALDANGYDLLITDHNMPKLTGVELLNKLHDARKTLPTILVTGSFPREELQRYPWLNISATLLKPFMLDELLAVVKQVLEPLAKSSATVTKASQRRIHEWNPVREQAESIELPGNGDGMTGPARFL